MKDYNSKFATRFDDWEIIEQEVIGQFVTKIWLLNKQPNGISIAHFVGGNIELELVKEDPSKEIEPTLKINCDIWRMIKKSLTEEKVREKNEVESELIATKYHLEDLRKLLKL